MSEDTLVQRVLANAAAAKVALDATAATRIAGAVTWALEHFTAARSLAMEVEPSTFLAVQRREVERR